ncbi:MAG TPA: T9SS type A sorting domain-containing protein [Flavipsychrobacter sp.]
MKKLLTFLCALLFTTAVQAQHPRLVGSFYYQYHPTEPQEDSIRIAYRAGNTAGGDADSFHTGMIKHDTVIHYTDGNDGNGYVPYFSYWVHYNTDGLVDTFETTDNGFPLKPSRKEVTIYNTQKNAISNDTWLWNTGTLAYEHKYRTQYSYAAGKVILALIQEYIANQWQNNGRTRYVYAMGRVDSVVREQWNYPANRWQLQGAEQYVYNSNGLMDTLRRIDSYDTVTSEEVYTYTATGKVMRTSWRTKMNGVFTPYHENLTVYNANDLPDTQYNYTPRGANPAVATGYTAWHYSAGNREDTVTAYGYDTGSSDYVPVYRTIHTYNSFHQRTMYYWERWDAGQWEDMGEYQKYYYDNIPTIGVAHNTTSFADVYIYPNPASSLLQVRVAAANAQPYTFTIYDAMGRRLRSHPSVQGQQVHTIPVSDLQPGTYTLSISNGAEKQSQQFVVAR